MAPEFQQSKRRDGTLSGLNMAIDAIGLAKEISSITPAKAVFGAVCSLLTMIRDSVANEQDYVELGLSCADVCRALDWGVDGKRLNDLSQPVRRAIHQLTTAVAEIRRQVVDQIGRGYAFKLFHARGDKDKIANWKLELGRILHVFNTELAINTNLAVYDIRDDVAMIRREVLGQNYSAKASAPGESPPPPPKNCFGRDDLIKKVVGLAEKVIPIALVGAGGIGKTSIALAVLHHARVKAQYGEDRRFIRCDQFPASRVDFLSRLSKVIGAGVENPEDLKPLRPYLSSKKIFIVIDNIESILDPQGFYGREIYDVIEELSQFGNICLCITSRITTVPPGCETLEIRTLSMEAARDAFYQIYKRGTRSDSVDRILKTLDFHPLSVTLLATIAHQNKWTPDRLVKEWEQHQTGVLRTGHNKSLAATIELSLASPMFRELGPDARGLLEVVAFFPRGVNENSLDFLIPPASNGTTIFDGFCVLSLTHRNNKSITMLSPLRDYLRPKDPMSSPHLRAIKEYYFTRMSTDLNPHAPKFSEAGWIASEDVNVEHLLNVLTSTNPKSDSVWEACANFMDHLYWHKPRQTVLRRAIEGLPDNHHRKPKCMFNLARLFQSVGKYAEQKRLLNHVLRLRRRQRNFRWVAHTLVDLSHANRSLHLHEEGILQAKEALEIYQRLGDTGCQGWCLNDLARLYYSNKQLDAAEKAASRAMRLFPGEGEEFLVCQSHRILGDIYVSKGEGGKAAYHFQAAISIATAFNWRNELFSVHHTLARLFLDECDLGAANSHVKLAKQHALNDKYDLGHATLLQARIWYQQRRLVEATSEASHALKIFEKLGAADRSKACKNLLKDIQQTKTGPSALDSNVRRAQSGTPQNRFSLILEKVPTTPTIRSLRPKSFPVLSTGQQSVGSPASRSSMLLRSPLPQSRPTLPAVTTPSPRRSHCIYFVPHDDTHRSLKFDPILWNVEEGNPPLRIGRFGNYSGPNASGVPGSNKLYFKSGAVSRAHAEIIAVTGGKLLIRDTKSSRGTFLNGVRLSPANSESRLSELKDGDVLQLGVDSRGGHEDADKCVKMRVEVNRKGRATGKLYKR